VVDKFKAVYKKWGVPFLFSLILSGVFISLLEYTLNSKKQELEKEARLRAVSFGSSIRSSFEGEINQIIYVLSGVQAYIQLHKGQLKEDDIQAILKNLYASTTVVKNFGVAEGTVLKYVYPIKGNEKAIGFDYTKQKGQWLEVQKAIEDKKGTLAGPVNLVQGGRALIYRLPVYIADDYWGILSTVVDLEYLVEKVIEKKEVELKSFFISIRNKEIPDELIFGESNLFEEPGAVKMESEVPNGIWEYAVRPKVKNLSSKMFGNYRWFARSLGVLNFLLIFYFLASYKRRKESQKELRALNQTKDTFFHIIAHDLKNPIISLVSALSILSRDSGVEIPEEKQKRILKSLYDSAVNTKKLLDSLLTWSLAQTDSLEWNPSSVSVSHLFFNVQEQAQSIADDKNIRLEQEVDGDMEVMGDLKILETVLRNLVTNALKFSEEGSKVQLLANKIDQSKVRVQVRDFGVGMEANVVSNLFIPGGVRSQAGTNNEMGTGLGLILVSELLKKHKSKIHVESKPGEGSVFWFDLEVYK